MPTSADLPIWVKYVATFAPLFVTTVAAAFAIYFSRRQAKHAHQRLKLDMFDRRYAVYKAIRTLISERTGRASGKINGNILRRATEYSMVPQT